MSSSTSLPTRPLRHCPSPLLLKEPLEQICKLYSPCTMSFNPSAAFSSLILQQDGGCLASAPLSEAEQRRIMCSHTMRICYNRLSTRMQRQKAGIDPGGEIASASLFHSLCALLDLRFLRPFYSLLWYATCSSFVEVFANCLF